MTIRSQKENIALDLNQSFRTQGLARFKKNAGNLQEENLKELELWSCLLLKEKPFLDTTPRAILVGDSHIVPNFKKTDTYLELTQRIQTIMPTLFMAQTSTALNRGALPGEATLYSPLFNSLHLKAIASSKCVVSFHLEPLLVAIANRVPAIFLSSRETEESQLAKKIGIPVVIGQEPPKMAAEIEMYFTHYAWKKIDEFCHLIKLKFSLPESLSDKTEPANSSELFNVCTITDSGYFPFFLGFIENVNNASQGNFKCFVLALDSQVLKCVKKMRLESKIEVLYIQDLWSPSEWQVVQKRNVGSRAFSTKPRLIERALKKTRGPVFYCDSDVFFFEPVTQLQKVIETDSIVLFPHFNDKYPEAQLDGLYNAGMLAVAPGAERFLDWWSEVCFRECAFDYKRGLIGDQAYLNLVPILFDKVKVFKGHNHNVARWNSQTLKLDLDPNYPESPIIEEGLSVSTYHAAFCDERGVYQKKFIWDHLASFFSPAYSLGSSKALDTNLRYQQAIYWTHLEHVAKWEGFLRRKIVNKMVQKLKVSSHWGFTSNGRQWIQFIVMANRALKHLKISSHSHLSHSEERALQNNSENWVNSNLKALQKDSSLYSNSKKVA